MESAMFFKSRTVLGHILRGILGFALLAVVLNYASELGWWTLAPALVALVCFGGCPMCWTLGLFETIISGRSSCAGGSCAKEGRL